MCFRKKDKLNFGIQVDRRKIPGLPSINDCNTAIELLLANFTLANTTLIQNVFKNLTIEWWNDFAPSPSTGIINSVVVDNDMVYSGLTTGNICKVAWRGKIFRSAFIHEILHFIGVVVLGDGDAEHKNVKLWEIENIVNKLLTEKNI